jgi:HEPN domain-containing protein
MGDYNWACFAAQQAIEKALKALILHDLGKYPRGHDLVKLYNMVRNRVSLELNIADLARVSSYYTQARCPNAGIERPSQEITREQAIEAARIAEVVIGEIERIIRDP